MSKKSMCNIVSALLPVGKKKVYTGNKSLVTFN